MIAAYLIDTNSKVSLDFLAEKYLMHKNIKYEDVIQKNRQLRKYISRNGNELFM